jgi:hypothetical protein
MSSVMPNRRLGAMAIALMSGRQVKPIWATIS